jgi:tRNA modification GTPase
MNDTIAAISTAFGEGAIAVLRLSGPQAVHIADRLFTGKTAPSAMASRVQHFGSLMEGDRKLDEVLLSVHRAPRSYTGEDVVEINCHGGVLVSRRILEAVLAQGARSAEPGEFTRRAFLSGKMDLTQAEAVMDLISAQTDLALRAATEQLEGRLGARVKGVREALIGILAHIEAYIDFPDEDIDPETGAALLGKLDAVRDEAQELLATARQGKILREGVRTVIYGEPNVGKSSLLNLWLGYERAIVSARPGTTRDVIEEVINLRGIPLRLVDTAGVRETADEVEREGMERTQRELARADLVLHVMDGSQERPSESVKIRSSAQVIGVLNKIDLGEHPSWATDSAVRISCLGELGIAALDAAVFDRIAGGQTAHRDWAVAINARHKACLESTLTWVQAAREALAGGLSAEFVAEELRAALDSIGDIVGRVDVEDILGRIFSTFCIGK